MQKCEEDGFTDEGLRALLEVLREFIGKEPRCRCALLMGEEDGEEGGCGGEGHE